MPDLATTRVPKFPIVRPSLHSELRKRVNFYFESNGILPTGNATLFIKAVIMVTVFMGTYLHLLIVQPEWYWVVIESIVLGLAAAGIGFNVMHDGSHGSFSTKKWLNLTAATSSNMLGASRFLWDIKHNVMHHSFTNIDGFDDDIEIGPLMRMAPTQKHYAIHRFQHIYFLFLYALLYFFWTFFSDTKKYFVKKIASLPIRKMTMREHIGFWMLRAYHTVIVIVLPLLVVKNWEGWLLAFLIAACVAGFTLSIVFQLAHTVGGNEFPSVRKDTQMLPDEFALHQLKTTANFCTKNKVLGWCVGGLNFQVEHHLFPKISHIHYYAISDIVRKLCAEYTIPYHENTSIRKAVLAHMRFLKQLGTK